MRNLFVFIMLVIVSGCSWLDLEDPILLEPAPYMHEITADVIDHLLAHYPPAHTRWAIVSTDDFGRDLIYNLRQRGYGVNEMQDVGAIRLGYIIDYTVDKGLLVLLCLGDSILYSRSYAVNTTPESTQHYFPISAWSRREMVMEDRNE